MSKNMMGSMDGVKQGLFLLTVTIGAFGTQAAVESAVAAAEADCGVPGLACELLRHDTKPLNYSFYDEVFKRVVLADRAADAAWTACDTPEKLQARQRELRAQAVAAMGGFPERTDLKSRVVGRIEKTGYAIEKILFESRPGFHVSAHLFLPTEARFKAPYPALLVPCGHSSVDAKWGAGYQRIGVFGARAGFAVLVFDPIDQGERRQQRDGATSWQSTREHNNVGVRAMLAGRSMAAIRLWDGMRALDYLETRADIDKDRLGVLGMSGGGTMSANVNAFDARIKAAAPAGFLSTVRDVYDNCGPQDAEQQFFGQLPIGLNHLGFVCLRAPSPTLMVVSHDDFFPLMGSLATAERAVGVYRAAGNASAFALQDAAGPHHWYQSNQRASVDWMRRWLYEDAAAWSPARGQQYRFEDAGFTANPDNGGCAFETDATRRCAPNGRVLDLPGERTIYEILNEEVQATRKRRVPVTPAIVREVSGIRPLADLRAVVCPNSARTFRADAFEAKGVVLQREDDMILLPVVLIEPSKTSDASPVLIVSDATNRCEVAAQARAWLDAGRRVAVADVRGFGETAFCRHSFYGAAKTDEETAVMLYALGDSIVARRAEDIALVARYVQQAFGRPPLVHAEGRAAIPAAHACYLEPAVFAGLEISRPPLSWGEVMTDASAAYPFSNCIHGAYCHYDWVELLRK